MDDYDATNDENMRRKLESKLWTRYGQERAIFVLDMSGFTRLTERYNVIHFLSMIQQMKTIVGPIVENTGGSVMEFHADNCFARFINVDSAVAAAISIMEELKATNGNREADRRINVCCGIDFGTIMFIEDGLFAGGPVNRASRLGENIARPGEILLTFDAIENLQSSDSFQVHEYDDNNTEAAKGIFQVLY